MLDLLWQARFRWKLRLRHVTGDTTYGTAENIVAVEDQGIHAYVPLSDFGKRTEFFGQSEFRYDADRDVYLCPTGHELHLVLADSTDQFSRYRARGSICNACPLKAKCTTSSTGRRLSRHIAGPYLERVRSYHRTPAYQKAMRKRSVWVEPLFAEAKQWHGLTRFRLRRLWKVNCEALMTASGQNIKRLLQHCGWGRRPIPTGSASATLPCYVQYVIRSNRLLATFSHHALFVHINKRAANPDIFNQLTDINAFFNTLQSYRVQYPGQASTLFVCFMPCANTPWRILSNGSARYCGPVASHFSNLL
jgi:hypothetical protein